MSDMFSGYNSVKTEGIKAYEAMRCLVSELAEYRCSLCAGQDWHEVCSQPDWKAMGQELKRILDQ